MGRLTVANVGFALLYAVIESGAVPCSTQLTSALKRSVPLIKGAFGWSKLPSQWLLTGYGKKR
jgi:hypothetical protein